MSVIVEVGAFEGKETLHFLADATATVYAFEPHVLTFQTLQKRSLEYPRLTVLPFAVDIGDNQEALFYYEGGESTLQAPYFTGAQPSSFKMVWTIRLDTFMSLYSVPQIDYLRIDAPYREEMILESLGENHSQLSRGRIRIYEGSDSRVPAWLYDHGFNIQRDSTSDNILQPDLRFFR
jgi:FkbM family methyltransferase